MREQEEFSKRWEVEEPTYAALGNFVTDTVCGILRDDPNIDLDSFLKICPIPRTKKLNSLLEKAFLRNKNYANPYEDITDKVGVRFVVLLRDHIESVKKVVEQCELWEASKDRDFIEEQKQHPKIFDYESVHYIVRLRHEQAVKGVTIPAGTPCEIQIRTLLQHACSELTHDAMYKSKAEPCATAERACSRAIALSEATDDCFIKTFEELDNAAKPTRNALKTLSVLYKEYTGFDAEASRASNLIICSLLSCMNDEDWQRLPTMLGENPHWFSAVAERIPYSQLHREPVVLIIYYFLKRKKHKLMDIWPLTRRELESLANDVGERLPE